LNLSTQEKTMRIVRIAIAVVATVVIAVSLAAQNKPAAVTSVRLYVFENGFIRGLDTKLFNLAREDVKEPDFVNSSYLIVHPRGTLQFDAGGIPDSAFKGDGATVTEGVQSATKPLLPQLAAAGYRPADVTYFALSHYHADHTGNANAFASSTWITQKAERDFMFSEKPEGIIQPATYSALRKAKTRILDNEDLDVFGDGSVRVISAPGHTPGHQVLLVRLAKRGPVLLAGDLYHYPEERAKGILPTFEFNADQSRAARAKIESVLKQTGAELWIEHDMATHAKLPKSPAYVE
jgi:glyoxylase-like metal-dependent hydrolase (beta-lactamase superfamily II)